MNLPEELGGRRTRGAGRVAGYASGRDGDADGGDGGRLLPLLRVLLRVRLLRVRLLRLLRVRLLLLL